MERNEATDRDLLEAAARAAGIELWAGSGGAWRDCFQTGLLMADGCVIWRPHLDSGQALELAVKLRINLDFTSYGLVSAWSIDAPYMDAANEIPADDPMAATRRAIVRAAVSLAKETK